MQFGRRKFPVDAVVSAYSRSDLLKDSIHQNKSIVIAHLNCKIYVLLSVSCWFAGRFTFLSSHRSKWISRFNPFGLYVARKLIESSIALAIHWCVHSLDPLHSMHQSLHNALLFKSLETNLACSECRGNTMSMDCVNVFNWRTLVLCATWAANGCVCMCVSDSTVIRPESIIIFITT